MESSRHTRKGGGGVSREDAFIVNVCIFFAFVVFVKRRKPGRRRLESKKGSVGTAGRGREDFPGIRSASIRAGRLNNLQLLQILLMYKYGFNSHIKLERIFLRSSYKYIIFKIICLVIYFYLL